VTRCSWATIILQRLEEEGPGVMNCGRVEEQKRLITTATEDVPLKGMMFPVVMPYISEEPKLR
jgi:hypothetical protein